jgi:hypothetical protein
VEIFWWWKLQPKTQYIGYLQKKEDCTIAWKWRTMFCIYQRGLSKSQLKTTWILVWSTGIQGWWNKKNRTFKKEWLKKFSLSFVYCTSQIVNIWWTLSGFDPKCQYNQGWNPSVAHQGATIFSTHRMESVEELWSHLIHKSNKLIEGKLMMSTKFKTNSSGDFIW